MVETKSFDNAAASDRVAGDALLEGAPGVLVVDDEPLMLEVVSLMLEGRGCRVFTAGDGLESIEVFKANRDLIDLVFMDFSLPGMNGHLAALEIRKIKPGVGIVIVSGLEVVPEVEELYRKREIEFLRKPFRETELMETLSSLQKSGKRAADL